jgi:DNA repair protein RadA/Sms
MAKTKTAYVCSACGAVHPRWLGRCPDCGQWDSLGKFVEPKPIAADQPPTLAATWAEGDDSTQRPPGAAPVGSIMLQEWPRLTTSIGELDRVLGGGIVPGSVVLLGGEPGIGKSTLLLQAALRLAAHRPILYTSSEESAHQIRLRADRLADQPGPASQNLFVLAETNLARIVEQARKLKPALLVIDSIQMIHLPGVDASPGSMSQIRRCGQELVTLAKVSGMAVMVVGHITKEGNLAGPKVLEHIVDVVLTFEGDRHHAYRVVRGVKNRFGTTLEVGLFEMTGAGLVEVPDGSLALNPREKPRPGSVVSPIMHGARCLLGEIQALTATGFLGAAKRKSSGLDSNRLAMIIAVLEKHGGLRLADQDVFASAVGGMKIVEPAADLALAAAIAGAHYSRSIPVGCAVLGEVGLGGEVRPVRMLEQRVRESVRLGYTTLMLPHDQREAASGAAQVIGIRHVADALQHVS